MHALLPNSFVLMRVCRFALAMLKAKARQGRHATANEGEVARGHTAENSMRELQLQVGKLYLGFCGSECMCNYYTLAHTLLSQVQQREDEVGVLMGMLRDQEHAVADTSGRVGAARTSVEGITAVNGMHSPLGIVDATEGLLPHNSD